jgi:hypothetical protein
MGAWILINGTWYYELSFAVAVFVRRNWLRPSAKADVCPSCSALAASANKRAV